MAEEKIKKVSKVRKYYMLRDHNFKTEKDKLLFSLETWERRIADILISKKNDFEKNKMITNILEELNNSSQKQENDKSWNEIINVMKPKSIQAKSKNLLYFLQKFITITDDGLIQYPDGEKGSSILNLLYYFTSPEKADISTPYDIKKIALILYNEKVPLSVFEKGKYPIDILQPPDLLPVKEEVELKWKKI